MKFIAEGSAICVERGKLPKGEELPSLKTEGQVRKHRKHRSGFCSPSEIPYVSADRVEDS